MNKKNDKSDLSEVLRKVEKYRSDILDDIERWKDRGYDYEEVDAAYDRGSVNALNWVIKTLEKEMKL